jgi:hypothetical protein
MTALMMFAGFDDDLVVVAPDAGRVKLNEQFATRLGAGLALLDKERPQEQVAKIGHVTGDVRRPSTSCRVLPLLTDSIRRIFTDDSVAEVFSDKNHLF